MLWFSTGLVKDFDLAESYVRQGVFNGRTSNFSIYSAASSNRVKKTVPAASRYNVAFHVLSSTTIGSAIFLEFFNGGTRLGYLRTKTSTFELEAYRDTTLIGTSTTIFTPSTKYHIEVDFYRDPTNGWFKVWVNGVLEINFVGNTGTTATMDGIYLNGYVGYSQYYSDIVISDEGRIGDVRVAYLPISGIGDTSEFNGVGSAGRPMVDYGQQTSSNTTLFNVMPVRAASTLKSVDVYGHTAGNVKIMTFRPNGIDFDTIYASALTALVIGVNTYVAGTHFDTDLALQAGDYVGVYCDSTAKVELNYTTEPNIGYNSVPGDKTGLTAVSYSYTTSFGPAGILPLYEITNQVDAYNCVNDKPTETYDHDFAYSNTADAKMLCNVDNIAVSLGMGTILGVQVSARLAQEGTPATPNANLMVKSGATEGEISTGTITTSVETKTALWTTNPATSQAWTQTAINTLQIGVKAKV